MKIIIEFCALITGLLRYHLVLKNMGKKNQNTITNQANLKLQRAIKHANKYSPYYAELFKKHKINVDSIKTIKDLKQLPIITKQEIRKNYNQIRTKNPSLLNAEYRTSGSTGEPLIYLKSFSNIAWEYAYFFRYIAAAGAGLGDKMAIVRTYVPKEGEPLWKKDSFRPILWLSAYHMSQEHLKDYISEIKKYGANFIRGYPSSLYILAKYCLDNNHQISFKGAFVSSETLDPEQKAIIEKAFSCQVFDYYGLSENVASCYHCNQANEYHVNPLYGAFEVIKEDGTEASPGEEGVIVATAYNNKAFPFIRYWTGDICKVSSRNKCECGLTTPLIERIKGRQDDILYGENNRPLPTVNFYSLFRDFREVENFQLIQSSPKKIDAYIIGNDLYTNDSDSNIKQQLELRIGKSIEISVIKTNDLRKNPIGKIRSLIRDY